METDHGPNFNAARQRGHKWIIRSYQDGVFMLETSHGSMPSYQAEIQAIKDCGRTYKMFTVRR